MSQSNRRKSSEPLVRPSSSFFFLLSAHSRAEARRHHERRRRDGGERLMPWSFSVWVCCGEGFVGAKGVVRKEAQFTAEHGRLRRRDKQGSGSGTGSPEKRGCEYLRPTIHPLRKHFDGISGYPWYRYTVQWNIGICGTFLKKLLHNYTLSTGTRGTGYTCTRVEFLR